MAGHSRNPGYEPGNIWIECERCGLDYRAEDIREETSAEGQSLLVCKPCFDGVQMQTFVRAIKPRISPERRTHPALPVDQVPCSEPTCTIFVVNVGTVGVDCSEADAVGFEDDPDTQLFSPTVDLSDPNSVVSTFDLSDPIGS